MFFILMKFATSLLALLAGGLKRVGRIASAFGSKGQQFKSRQLEAKRIFQQIEGRIFVCLLVHSLTLPPKSLACKLILYVWPFVPSLIRGRGLKRTASQNKTIGPNWCANSKNLFLKLNFASIFLLVFPFFRGFLAKNIEKTYFEF